MNWKFMMISSLDYTILEWIHLNRIESLDEILRLFSSVTTYVSIVLIIATGMYAYFKKEGFNKPIQLIITLLLAALVSFTMKSTINRERPFETHDNIEKLSTGGSSSFPSGHTFEAFAMATTISLIFRRRKITIPILSWAILVGYSRMALGVHYFSDVLGGMTLGILLAIGINHILKKYMPIRKIS